MAITLVPKYVRALAEQLNAYYRVFRGVDPDSVDIRLNGGGRFAVHHSGTNAVVFQVTDAGAAGSYQPGDIGTADLADGAVTSLKIADGTIMDADVNGAAGIALAKLAHVGAGNVLRSNGTTNVPGQVVTGDIADGTIMNADVNANAALAPSKLATVTANQILRDVGAGVLGGGLLLDANVAPSGTANIAINKLADVGAGNVLRSNGAGNVAGKIVSGDITDGAIMNVDINATAGIDGSKLADNSVPSIKLSGGIPPPINTIDSTHIIDGAIMPVDCNVATLVRKLGELVSDGVTPYLEISGIPATYRRLELQVIGRSTIASTQAQVTLTFEATPSPGVYCHQRLFGNVTTPGASENIGTTNSIFVGVFPAASSSGTLYGSSTISLPEYANPGIIKIAEIRTASTFNTASAGLIDEHIVGLWMNNVAISRVRLTLGGGAWTTSSRMTLYGYPA